MMRRGTDSADTGSDLRHVLHRAAFGEFLEAAQFGDLKISALYATGIVEEDVDLPVPLQPRDRVDGDPVLHCGCRGHELKPPSSFSPAGTPADCNGRNCPPGRGSSPKTR